MRKIGVLGAGFQGTACVYDLLTIPGIDEVVVADSDAGRIDALASTMANVKNAAGAKLSTGTVDVNNHAALVDFLKPCDVVISAVPYFLNLQITSAAIEAGTHMVDMGGNTDLVFEQRKLDADARANNVTVLPDCGLAPGMANIIAAHAINQLDTVEKVQIRVGGLPQNPRPPLNYRLFFSIHGLINEYMGRSVVLRDGQITEVDTLTEVETVRLSAPVGSLEATELEAFHTLGGLSTLPWTYEGRIPTMDYKTLRYPGHCAQIKAMAELGLLDETPVAVEGHTIVPRRIFAALAEPKLDQGDRQDVVIVIVTAEGRKDGQSMTLRYELVDYYDAAAQLTAMMRTTAFPVAIVARMLADGTIGEHGVLSLETAVPSQQFLNELGKRRIDVKTTQSVSV